MNIFISHSSEDNKLAKRVVAELTKCQVDSHWIDFEVFKDASKIRSEINTGLENCDTFLLLWSKNAKPSIYVKEEIDAVCSPPYSEKIQKIIFKLDNTDLRPLDNILKYRKIDPAKIEESVKDVVTTYSKSFNEKYEIFRQTVRKHYENIPQYPEKPIISNFKKLENGAKYYVRQKYKNRSTHEFGEDVFDFSIRQIKLKLKQIQRKKELQIEYGESQKSLDEYQKIIDKLSEDGVSFKPEDLWNLENNIFKHEQIPNEFVQILKDIKDSKQKITKIKKSHDNIKKAEAKIRQIELIRQQIEENEREYKRLSSLDLAKASEKDLELRKSQIEKFPNTISELKTSLNHRLEEESKSKEIIRDESKNNETLEDVQLIITQLESKISSANESTQNAYASAKELLSKIKKYDSLKSHLSTIKSELNSLTQEKLIPITGDYGSGKSSLSNHIMNALCDYSSEDLVVFFIPLGSLPKNDEQSTNLKNDILNYINDEYDFYLTIEEYQKLIDSGKIVLILDALDELSDKLDSTIGQRNLERIIELAKDSVVLLTSRDTYLSETMDKKLFEYDDVIKIEDFELDEIEKFLSFKNSNETLVNDIMSLIRNDENIGKLARKPLFLNVINENSTKISQHRIINESVIFAILTERWIVHDPKIKEETDPVYKEELKKSREKISEILSFAKKGIDESISIDDIKVEVKHEMGRDDPDVVDKLEEYYKDAITSTFLVKEQDNTFRFVINPVREYFRARRIVNAIQNEDIDLLLNLSNMITSKETFDFIKGLLEIEWSIKPHLIKKINEDHDDVLQKLIEPYEEKPDVLLNALKKTQELKNNQNVSNILRILNISGKLPHSINLNNLNFENAELPNIDLFGCDLSNSNFTHANLKGANLCECDLSNTIFISSNLANTYFYDSILLKTNFSNSNLTLSNLRDSKIEQCNFYQSKLCFANLGNVYFENSILKKVDFSSSNLEKVDFSNGNLSECVFLQTDLKRTKISNTILRSTDFRGTDLKKVDFSYCDLYRANFSGSDLSNAILNRADLSRSVLSGVILENTDLHRTNLSDVVNLPITKDEAVERGAIF